MKILLLNITLFLLCSMHLSPLKAQDTILHQNGNIFLVEIIDIGDEYVSYKLWNKNNEQTYRLDRFSIFSISRTNQEEEILYAYDPEHGNIYEVDEMRIFIKGEQDAQAGFNSPFAIIGGAVGGAAGGYLLGQGNFIGITALVVAPALISIFPTKVKDKSVRDPKFMP